MNAVTPTRSEIQTVLGLVRIKPGNTPDASAQISNYGVLEIDIPSNKITADVLLARLSQLGITKLDEKQLEKIANKNGNEVFDKSELNDLDKYLEKTLACNREFILAAAKENGQAIQYASEELKRDKEVVLAAVKTCGLVLKISSEELKGDKEVVLAAVKQNGLALEFASKELKGDKEVVLAAVKQNGQAIQYASEELKGDKEVVLAAVKQNVFALKYAHESLKRDISFLKVAFNVNFNIYKFIPAEIKKEFTKEYERILKDLQDLDIEFLKRFKSPKVVQEIIKNRKNLRGSDSRPLAVIVYPKKDGRGAFENNQIEELIKRGYRVVYFEAKTDKEAFDALIAATAARPADLLVIGGHGDRTHLALGADDPAKSEIENEENYIDLSDEEKMKKNNLSERLAKRSVIILESCSTGEGKEGANNVANLLRKIFPHSMVFAPVTPTSVVHYNYDENERIIGITYSAGEENTYSIRPQ
jgi:hypothetical protein